MVSSIPILLSEVASHVQCTVRISAHASSVVRHPHHAAGRSVMTTGVRPVLLGYVRGDVLRDRADLPRVEAMLDAFAAREAFSLGAVYVENGSAPGAFDALMTEVARDETAHGIVVPDLRHVTLVEQLVLSRHEEGARTPIFTANFTPHAGGPGVCAPDARQARRSISRAFR